MTRPVLLQGTSFAKGTLLPVRYRKAGANGYYETRAAELWPHPKLPKNRFAPRNMQTVLDFSPNGTNSHARHPEIVVS